jgi:hypothetical protein
MNVADSSFQCGIESNVDNCFRFFLPVFARYGIWHHNYSPRPWGQCYDHDFFPIFGEKIDVFLIVIFVSLDSSNMRQKHQFFRRIFRQDYFKTLTPDQMYIQPRPPFLPV